MNFLKNKIIIYLVCICIIAFIFFNILKNKEENDMYDELEDVVENNNMAQEIVNKESEEIIIHIAGEVKNPGIIKLKKGDRVDDAVKASGGITKEADLSKINLASILEDGEKIVIPNKNVESEIEENDNEGGKVNINKATVEELQRLPGIGASTAYKIVEYREKNGKFKNLDEIKNIKGIGESRYEEIKDDIKI